MANAKVYAVKLDALPLTEEARGRVGATLTRAVLEELARTDKFGDLVIAGRLGPGTYGYVDPDLTLNKKLVAIVDEAIKGP